MKLAQHIDELGLTFDQAATEIGGVSVSGLRKWLSGERVPRPDQMRRVHIWSAGRVSPNDFILPHAQRAQASSSLPDESEDEADAAACHVNAATSASPARAAS